MQTDDIYFCPGGFDELFTRSLRWRGRHLWDEQQAEGDGHGQVSVSEEQHEHPVGVQPRHQGEPAQKQHKGGVSRLWMRKPDWNSSDSAPGSRGGRQLNTHPPTSQPVPVLRPSSSWIVLTHLHKGCCSSPCHPPALPCLSSPDTPPLSPQ